MARETVLRLQAGPSASIGSMVQTGFQLVWGDVSRLHAR